MTIDQSSFIVVMYITYQENDVGKVVFCVLIDHGVQVGSFDIGRSKGFGFVGCLREVIYWGFRSSEHVC